MEKQRHSESPTRLQPPAGGVRTLGAVALLMLTACVSSPRPDGYQIGQGQLNLCAETRCETLDLDGLGLADYSQLTALSHVTSLMVSSTDLQNLDDVEQMTQLQELHIGFSQVADFSAVANLPNLTLLHIQNLSADQLATLQAPASLRELAVGRGSLTDLTVMTRLPQVQRLYVDPAGVGFDLSALDGHPGLRSLHLTNLRGIDITPLLGARGLRELSFTGSEETLDPVQASVIAQLRARGVRVYMEDPVVIVC